MKSAANAAPVNMAHKDAAARRMDVTGMMAHLPQMPVAVWFRGALPLIAFALFSFVAQCPGATILAKSDIRLWQTVHDRAAPLTWSWEEGADAATLTFSNRVLRTAWSRSVSRAPGEMRGSCVQPAPTEGETVVDVTLVQKAGANEVARARRPRSRMSPARAAGRSRCARRCRRRSGSWRRYRSRACTRSIRHGWARRVIRATTLPGRCTGR